MKKYIRTKFTEKSKTSIAIVDNIESLPTEGYSFNISAVDKTLTSFITTILSNGSNDNINISKYISTLPMILYNLLQTTYIDNTFELVNIVYPGTVSETSGRLIIMVDNRYIIDAYQCDLYNTLINKCIRTKGIELSDSDRYGSDNASYNEFNGCRKGLRLGLSINDIVQKLKSVHGSFIIDTDHKNYGKYLFFNISSTTGPTTSSYAEYKNFINDNTLHNKINSLNYSNIRLNVLQNNAI